MHKSHKRERNHKSYKAKLRETSIRSLQFHFQTEINYLKWKVLHVKPMTWPILAAMNTNRSGLANSKTDFRDPFAFEMYELTERSD